MIQFLWDSAKTVLRGKIILIKFYFKKKLNEKPNTTLTNWKKKLKQGAKCGDKNNEKPRANKYVGRKGKKEKEVK